MLLRVMILIGIKATNTYSNKNNKVVNVVQVDDEVLSRDSEKQRRYCIR